jgi:hypothetical protein
VILIKNIVVNGGVLLEYMMVDVTIQTTNVLEMIMDMILIIYVVMNEKK